MQKYVIFITEKDKFGKGLPLYHIDRIIAETNEPVGDGSHIIYVNGSYHGDDPIGKLMHDFNCKSSDDIYYKELSDGVKRFKETKAGKYALDEIASLTDLPIDRVQSLQKNLLK